ncbi:MAG TPA: hypothetical protein VHS99_21165 [Chloroflexota bacterium]|nr:hypothetical protein [Chloroflexota bacterium]
MPRPRRQLLTLPFERPVGPMSVEALVAWLAREGEAGSAAFVFWNAARLPIAEACARAQRLPPDAVVEVWGSRILVVEPLRRPDKSGRGAPPGAES